MNFSAFKMDGLGNDFLIIDNRKQKVYLNEKQIQKLSNRENGIGFDQLIYIENLEKKAFKHNYILYCYSILINCYGTN